MTALFTTKNRATTVRTPRKPSFPRTLYSRPVISWYTGPKKDTRTEVRAIFNSQATVDSTQSPSPWKNETDCTTVPPMSSRSLRILLVLAYPPSTASRPQPFRSHPPKSVANDTTRSTETASQSLKRGCSNSAHPAKTNWIFSPAMSLAFLPVSYIIRIGLSIGRKRHEYRNKLLSGLPNVPPRQNDGSTWILVSCALPHPISLVPTRTNRVVASYDGFSSYLLIVNEATRFIWVFLTKSKAPPLDILDTFLTRFGHENGGLVRTDQGGELARSFALSDLLL